MRGASGELTFDKADLVERIMKNRDNHWAQFEEALLGWQRAVEQRLQRMLEDARKGKRIDEYVSLPRPEDHTKAYDRILLMLDMAGDERIALNEQEFAQYVQDDWGWKEKFITTNALYSA